MTWWMWVIAYVLVGSAVTGWYIDSHSNPGSEERKHLNDSALGALVLWPIVIASAFGEAIARWTR